MNGFQTLENPQLVELDGESGFVIATEVDLSVIKNGWIYMRGQSYNYENGELLKGKVKELQYNIKENAYFDLDEDGKVI